MGDEFWLIILLLNFSEVYNMRDCIINRIRDCGANTYLELFNLFYRSLLSLTPCK